MGQRIGLRADDHHVLSAYRSDPDGASRGGLVVIQEVFGVNEHIRTVCDRFAAHGYTAVAPALFDRVRPEVELAYDEGGIAEGRALVAEIGWDKPLLDVRAAVAALPAERGVGVVGYCWGGTVAWLAACRLHVICAVAYYGRQIVDFLDDGPRCPVLMHFGAADTLIPQEAVKKIKVAYPPVPVHIYKGAGHGFNCEQRADYRPEAAALALDRTLAFFRAVYPSPPVDSEAEGR